MYALAETKQEEVGGKGGTGIVSAFLIELWMVSRRMVVNCYESVGRPVGHQAAPSAPEVISVGIDHFCLQF